MEIIVVDLALDEFILDRILFVYEISFISLNGKYEPVWSSY